MTNWLRLNFALIAGLSLAGVVGCGTTPVAETAHQVGHFLTNSVPFLHAAAGATAAVPATAPISPIVSAIGVLAAGLGGYLVRHFMPPSSLKPPKPGAPTTPQQS